MINIEAQLTRFRSKLKRYQGVFKEYKKYSVGLAFDNSVIKREEQLREELNQMWGKLENTIIKLWSERPKFKQYGEVFPIFETALSGDFESSLTGAAIEKAIQVVIKCIGIVKSKPEMDEYATGQVEKKKIDYGNKEPLQITPLIPWYKRWWMKYLIFPIIVVIIGGIIVSLII